MKLELALIIGGLGILGMDEPGWLARALASTDPDVDAAIVAYDAEDYAEASERLDDAVDRRGERSELYYDRGLILVATGDLEGARGLFQNGTLSEDSQVRASSHYQLGNLALAGEDWDAAIDEFRKCLRVLPDHENAKWNLELALLRKEEQEKREQEEKEKQEQEKEKQEQEQEKQDQEQQDQEKQEGEQDQEKQEGEQQGEQDKQGEQDQQDQQQAKPGEQQAQPQAIEGSDLDATLDELDRQDAFMFGRPRGQGRKVEKDW
jgi:Ca-activated chloride channel homolog